MYQNFKLVIMKYFQRFSQKPNSLFQFIFWNLFFGYLPFGLFIALLSLFGNIAFTLNNQPVYGITGFLGYVICIPFVILIFTVVFWIFFSIGNFLIRIITRL
jgi:hypothetical protein